MAKPRIKRHEYKTFNNLVLRGGEGHLQYIYCVFNSPDCLDFQFFQGCSFEGTIIKNGDFSFCKLARTSLVNARITNTTFEGSTILQADFRNAEFKEVSFDGAQFDRVDLSTTRLIRVTFRNAIYTEGTKWPLGFDPAEHGARNVGEQLPV